MFLFVLAVGTYIVIDKDSHENAIEVFNSSLIFLGTILGIIVYDKQITTKSEKTAEQNEL